MTAEATLRRATSVTSPGAGGEHPLRSIRAAQGESLDEARVTVRDRGVKKRALDQHLTAHDCIPSRQAA